MLEGRDTNAVLPLSDFSRLVYNLIVDAGLPEPVLEYRITSRDGQFIMQTDLAWPLVRKAIELDGLEWHFGRNEIERDRRKRARARAEGWHIMEVLWSMYSQEQEDLVELIASFLGPAPITGAPITGAPITGAPLTGRFSGQLRS